ncbi:MAG: ATP-binding cassette domain-containing protein [Trebonia sp.]
MNQDSWLTAFASELRRAGLGTELAGNVVAEAAAHLRDSREPPLSVFGPPGTYAAAVAGSLRLPRSSRARHGGGWPVRLDARGIGKRYRRQPVLHGVDLAVRAGQIAAVVGANGCGKSTFLRICAGLVSPDHGSVRVSGNIGYCPQDGGTCESLTADEHFILIGAGRGMPRQAARAVGCSHAARLDWTASRGPQARHLSGGTRQKLNLVMASLGEPDVLLLDEPYQGFDRGAYLDFWHEVEHWRDCGKAIVVVTHMLSQLDRADIVLDLTSAGGRAA